MRGLLIRGKYVVVPGVDVLGPDELPWVHLLDSGPHRDAEPREHDPQQWILHKTIADDPELVLAGAGPAAHTGGAEDTALEWAHDGRNSGAPIIVGYAGAAACLEDLARMTAYHDGNYASNKRAVGLEMKERPGGGCYAVTYAATCEITAAGTNELGLQRQCPKLYKLNRPLPRFANGGTDLVGCFGHRDVSDHRGRWDPGDLIFDMLEATHGFERFDFYAGEDLDVWAKRQERLKALGYYRGAIDGVPFKATTAALLAAGFPGGIYTRGRELAERIAL